MIRLEGEGSRNGRVVWVGRFASVPILAPHDASPIASLSLQKSPAREQCLTQRIHVPNNEVLGFWVVVAIVQVLGKYMIFKYLDP